MVKIRLAIMFIIAQVALTKYTSRRSRNIVVEDRAIRCNRNTEANCLSNKRSVRSAVRSADAILWWPDNVRLTTMSIICFGHLSWTLMPWFLDPGLCNTHACQWLVMSWDCQTHRLRQTDHKVSKMSCHHIACMCSKHESGNNKLHEEHFWLGRVANDPKRVLLQLKIPHSN